MDSIFGKLPIKRGVVMGSKEFSFELKREGDMTSFMEAFENYGEQNIIDEKIFYDIRLCLEELIINIFRHGYKTIDRSSLVSVKITKDKNMIIAQVEDNAMHFDPFNNIHRIDTLSSIEDRAIGGVGIHLIK
ncbi:MAG: ATP-binding protein, partial [Halobacteriovoraceae bacterium]|nr:ATP-binding protein [Halobacteriovoraceae bacterium]